MSKETTVLEIGGIRLGFAGHEGITGRLRARYSGFLRRGAPQLTFLVGAMGRKEDPGTPSVVSRGGELIIRRGDFRCLLDERTGTGRLDIHPSVQSFDSFLRTLCSRILMRSGGAMIHSAALLISGNAFLFPGKSGAGKSTLSRLAASAGCEVISDELNMLRFKGGRFMAYGSPFWGEMRNEGRQGSWPLRGIFIIGKARTHRASAEPPGKALTALLRCLMNFSREPEAAREALLAVSGLLSGVPVRRLWFSDRDAGFLRLLAGRGLSG